MRPVLPGARGAAVEDIQRRLLRLGFDLGSTGVDGVFLGMTTEAVRDFQRGADIDPNGVVDEHTWSALVDATFILGDRMLYLRLPYFHGCDVRVLQEALNTLGFPCGRPDAIFGRHTEHAVREFQANCGHSPDGIVGRETVMALNNLRHVWDGKDGRSPASAHLSSARAAGALASTAIRVVAEDESSADIADRIVNLARASEPSARVSRDSAGDADIVVRIAAESESAEGMPLVAATESASEMSGRVLTALAARRGSGSRSFVVHVPVLADERERQRLAVRVLDAMCAALESSA